jgi:hypothetical protein
MTLRKRLLIAFAIGIAGFAICYVYQVQHGNSSGDIWVALCAGRALLAHQDSYAVCQSIHADGVTPLTHYPLTTALLLLPLTPLPDALSAAILLGLSSGLLAFGLAREAPWRLLVFLAFPYWDALRWVQWSPLLMAVALFPALLPLTLVKPHIGASVALTRLTLRRALSCLLFAAVSLLIDPTWPWRWIAQTSHYTGFIPLLIVPGPLLLLALLRWRDSDARFLLLMAMAPQRVFYDQLLLWLLPRTARQMLTMVGLSWLAYLGAALWPAGSAALAIIFIYGGALALILRRTDALATIPHPERIYHR